MKKLRVPLFLFLTAVSATIISCKKENSCYSEALYMENKDAVCTTDCPGVIGCDGKMYCNACDAAREGIRVD